MCVHRRQKVRELKRGRELLGMLFFIHPQSHGASPDKLSVSEGATLGNPYVVYNLVAAARGTQNTCYNDSTSCRIISSRSICICTADALQTLFVSDLQWMSKTVRTVQTEYLARNGNTWVAV